MLTSMRQAHTEEPMRRPCDHPFPVWCEHSQHRVKVKVCPLETAAVVRTETNHWQMAPKVLMDFSEKQKSQRNKSFKSLWISALARTQFWVLTINVKQLKCFVVLVFFAVFILELAIFKVAVPAKGGNCISRVLGIKQRKEKGTEKVAAFTQRAQMFCFLPCSVCSKTKKRTLQ